MKTSSANPHSNRLKNIPARMCSFHGLHEAIRLLQGSCLPRIRKNNPPEASPFGRNFGFRMSRNTGRHEKQGEEDKDEKEDKPMTRECSSKKFDDPFSHFLSKPWGRSASSRVGCAQPVMHQPKIL